MRSVKITQRQIVKVLPRKDVYRSLMICERIARSHVANVQGREVSGIICGTHLFDVRVM